MSKGTRTSEWNEIRAHKFGGWGAEVKVVVYEAGITYADGVTGTANALSIFFDGEKIYSQEFYGENSLHDAIQAADDAATPFVPAEA